MTLSNPPQNVVSGEIIESVWGNRVVNSLNELDAEKLDRAGDTMTGALNMDGHVIGGLGDPTTDLQAVSRGYADGRYVNVGGDTMTGNLQFAAPGNIEMHGQAIDCGGGTIQNVGDPIAGGGAMSRDYADARYVNVGGDTMTGRLAAAGFDVTGTGGVFGTHLIVPTGVVRSGPDDPLAASNLGCELGQGGTIKTTKNAAGDPNIILRHVNASNAGGEPFIRFIISTNNTVIGSITQTSTTGVAYNTTSDYRLKDEQGPVTEALGLVDRLRPIVFSWKDDPERGVQQGFLAHEVADVIPHAVTGEKDAVVGPDDPGGQMEGAIIPQQLDASQLVPVLTAAIKDLAGQVATLTDRITQLEGGTVA